jgi:hypothetical protein
MIKILLSKQGTYFIFTIEGKKINAIIRKHVLPYQPPNLQLIRREVLKSRNTLPAWLMDLFTITPSEQAEYEGAKTEEDLKEIIIKDAKKEDAKIIDIKYE